jgi:NAD(P)-dependent dehydrogenase (short-subunit alcohol dehydrogenase family)
MSDRLLGKVPVIIGTGGSIGREAALTFAGEGTLVVGCDLQVTLHKPPLRRFAPRGNDGFHTAMPSGPVC